MFRFVSALAAGASLAAVGCSSGLHPVTGTVAWDGGAPATELNGGSVIFEREGGGSGAAGSVGPDARFTLTTARPGDGVAPGRYKVLVNPFPANPSENRPQVLDPKYRSFETSGLTATVEPRANDITLTIGKPPKGAGK